MAGKGGSVNVTLEQRIDNILGPWPMTTNTRLIAAVDTIEKALEV